MLYGIKAHVGQKLQRKEKTTLVKIGSYELDTLIKAINVILANEQESRIANMSTTLKAVQKFNMTFGTLLKSFDRTLTTKEIREYKINILSRLVDREITTTKDLSYYELVNLKDILERKFGERIIEVTSQEFEDHVNCQKENNGQIVMPNVQ